MATLVPGRTHPALDLSIPQRVLYLSVVATLVGADRVVDDSEVALLSDLCGQLEITPEGTEQVLARARDVDQPAADAELDQLSGADIRYALVVDVVDIIYADGTVDNAELEQVSRLARRVGVSGQQVGMIRRYVEARRT